MMAIANAVTIVSAAQIWQAPSQRGAADEHTMPHSLGGFDAHAGKEKAPVALRGLVLPATGLIHQFTPNASRTYSTAA